MHQVNHISLFYIRVNSIILYKLLYCSKDFVAWVGQLRLVSKLDKIVLQIEYRDPAILVTTGKVQAD